MPAAVPAVVPPVAGVGHVLISSLLGMENGIACLARDFGCPMVRILHVLVASLLGAEGPTV